MKILLTLLLAQLVFASTNMDAFKPCPDSPNCVNSKDTNPKKSIAPIKSELDQNQIIKKVSEIEGIELVEEKNNFLHFVHTSSFFKFKDDIYLLIEDGVIQIKSQSRTGYYDFNANKKRVEKIRKILSEK